MYNGPYEGLPAVRLFVWADGQDPGVWVKTLHGCADQIGDSNWFIANPPNTRLVREVRLPTEPPAEPAPREPEGE